MDLQWLICRRLTLVIASNSKVDLNRMKVKVLIWGAIIVGMLTVSTCDLPHQPGPMPDTIIDTTFEPGMNIFGVIRLGDSTNSSFVYIERAYAPNEYDAFADTIPLVKNAAVVIKRASDSTAFLFLYSDSSGDHKYLNPNFIPVAGETYNLSISAPGLPSLSASATVPRQPEIDTSSVRISATELSFTLLTSDDTYLYDIYVISQNGQLSQREKNSRSGMKNIKIALNQKFDRPTQVKIFGYDQNLARYFDASSSLIPQSFLETLSTVNGGYGCFGAVAVRTIAIP